MHDTTLKYIFTILDTRQNKRISYFTEGCFEDFEIIRIPKFINKDATA